MPERSDFRFNHADANMCFLQDETCKANNTPNNIFCVHGSLGK